MLNFEVKKYAEIWEFGLVRINKSQKGNFE